MNKLLKRGLMGLAAVAIPASAAMALPMAANAAPAQNTNSSVTSLFGYQNVDAGTLTKHVTTNNNWKIVDETFVVTAAPGQGYQGWVATYNIEQKTPAGQTAATSLTGTVTLTTPYGTATQGFAATDPTVLPFDINSDGQLVANTHGSNSTATVIYGTEVHMVYSGLNPGVNAYYWS